MLWLIFLANNIVDPYYSWPLTQNTFQDFIISKYGTIANAKSTIKHYRYQEKDKATDEKWKTKEIITKETYDLNSTFSTLRTILDPQLQRTLRENPSERAAFIEEVLRLDSPFKGHFRVLMEAAEIGGVAMNAGTRLMLHWGLANQDATMFVKPNELAHDRPNLRKHVAFGHGIHRCIGSGLAQMEAHEALRVLLDILPEFKIKETTEPREKKSVFTKRLEDLHLEFQSA